MDRNQKNEGRSIDIFWTETLKNFDDETIFFLFAKPTSNNLF